MFWLMLVKISAALIVLGLIVENVYARVAGRRLYGLSDTFVNVAALAVEETFMVLVATPVYLLYYFVYQHRLASSIPEWLFIPVALIGVDFGFYWWHRLSHRMMLMWWGHSAHHSSEEFNVAVAFRMSGWALWTQRFFYLLLALLGVPVAATVFADGISGIYALFIHNRVIGKLGVIEWIFVTPSHHRVHHGRNPEYLDKNYGEMLIVWDRLFGTFAEEVAEPVYGLRVPLQTHNVVWARFHVLFEMVDRARRAKGFWQKLSAPFRPPEWDPAGVHDVTAPAVPPAPLVAPATGWRRRYALAQHLLLLPVVAAFMALGAGLEVWQQLGIALWIWASFAVAGGLLEERRWAVAAEASRWLVAVIVLVAVVLLVHRG